MYNDHDKQEIIVKKSWYTACVHGTKTGCYTWFEIKNKINVAQACNYKELFSLSDAKLNKWVLNFKIL